MNKEKYHVVIVEDDNLLRTLIVNYFRRSGFFITEFSNTSGVVDWVKRKMFDPFARLDVIICDVELPAGSGLDLFKKLHAFNQLGKILISIRKEEQDRILGFKVGADDYVCKPLNLEELLLRTQSLLRKLHQDYSSPQEDDYIQFGQCLLHPETRLLIFKAKKTLLTEGEHQILLSLISKQGKTVTREDLASALGKHFLNISSRSVDVLVGRLRKKLQDNAKIPERIVTCRGKGYMLVCSD